MRILYLHQYFATPAMAGGTRSYEMARRWVRAGHTVDLITSDQSAGAGARGWRVSREDGIRVHWTPVPYSNHMGYLERMRAFVAFATRAGRRAAEVGGDLVFATSTPLTIALPAVYAARRLRVPMVFEVRDLWPAVPIAIGAIRNPAAVGAARWLERFAYDHSAHIVALAPGMREDILRLGYAPERVSVVPNGADLEFFTRPEDEVRKLRASREWLGERPMVLFAGTFGRVNGVDYLARLAAEYARLDPETRFVGIGDGRELEPVRALAAALGVLDRNLFLLGPLPKREVATWLAAADLSLALFTGPSIVWRDAVQNKFFDALAAGKPVANNFRGWQALVAEEAGAGVVLDAADCAVAARQLHERMQDRRWMASAARAASRLAQERFDRDRLATQLLERLETVAAGAGR